MDESFRGEFHLKVDGKGRVSIPADFRRVLELSDPNWSPGQRPNFVIVFGDEQRHFLECFTMKAIAEVEAKIARIPRGTPRRRKLERCISSLSQKCEVDNEGRIVLAQRLRDKLGLETEVLFAATLDTFQIWKKETYLAELDAPLEDDFLSLLDSADEG